MLARLQTRASLASSPDTAHEQLEASRRTQRERWRAERGEVVGAHHDESRGNVRRNVRDDGSEEPARLPVSSTATTQHINGSFVLGAALRAGVLGYTAVRAYRSWNDSGGGRENDRSRETIEAMRPEEGIDSRRKEQQEAADLEFAQRLQREEELTYLSRQRETRTTNDSGSSGTGDDSRNHSASRISLGPFVSVRVETTSQVGTASGRTRSLRDSRPPLDPMSPPSHTHEPNLLAEMVNALLRAHQGAFARGSVVDTFENNTETNTNVGANSQYYNLDTDSFDFGFEAHAWLIERLQRWTGNASDAGANNETMRRMPVRTFCCANEGSSDDSEVTCAVCLCDAQDGDSLRRLPCKHEFHVQCVDRWLENHTTCPLCKTDVGGGRG